jgi:hypothetical protein
MPKKRFLVYAVAVDEVAQGSQHFSDLGTLNRGRYFDWRVAEDFVDTSFGRFSKHMG